MRILSLCAVLLLILSLALPAFATPAYASVIDPYDYASSVAVDGDNELVTVSLPVENIFWRRYHNDVSSFSGTGSTFEYNLQVRYIDNDQIFCHYFGESNVIATDGIPTGCTVSGLSRMRISVMQNGVLYQGQTYDTIISAYCYLYDSDGVKQKQLTLGTTQTTDLNGFLANINWSLSTDEFVGYSYFAIFMLVDFNDIADESDTTQVTMDASGSLINFVIPFNQLAQLKAQGEKTNKLLSAIDSTMQDNGLKLDDVLAEQQDTNNKLDDIMNNTVPAVKPDDSGKVDVLDDAEAGLRDDASSGLDEGLGILADALDILVTYTQAFSALGLIFGYFAGIPFFSALLYLSFALGILATILGAGLSVASRFGNSHSNREGKSSSGGKSK